MNQVFLDPKIGCMDRRFDTKFADLGSEFDAFRQVFDEGSQQQNVSNLILASLRLENKRTREQGPINAMSRVLTIFRG